MADLFPWKNISDFKAAARELDWAGEIWTSLPIPDRFIKQFCVEKTWRDFCQIELSEVKGTRHPDYKGLSWLDLLEKGKRMTSNLADLFANPGYYFSAEKKLPSMSYLRVGESLYVDHDGNHRTCIARFYVDLLGESQVLNGVEVTDLVVDNEAYELWRQLGGSRGLVAVHSSKISRDDGPGWMTEYFRLRFTSYIGGKVLDGLTKEDLYSLSAEGKTTWWNKIKKYFKKEVTYEQGRTH